MEPEKGGAREGHVYRGNDYNVSYYASHSEEISKTVPHLGDRQVKRRNQYFYETIQRPQLVPLDDYRKSKRLNSNKLLLPCNFNFSLFFLYFLLKKLGLAAAPDTPVWPGS